MSKSYRVGPLSAYALAVQKGYEGSEDQFAAELTGATDAARAAAQDASDAEAYAIGKRGGVEVGITDPAYHNNAKYYKEFLEVDDTLSVPNMAADAKKTGDEIQAIKNAFGGLEFPLIDANKVRVDSETMLDNTLTILEDRSIIKSSVSNNLFDISEESKLVNGVNITSGDHTGTIYLQGTGTKTGGSNYKLTSQITLSPGKYVLTINGITESFMIVLRDEENNVIASAYNNSTPYVFELEEKTTCYVGINVIKDTVYDGTAYIQIESGSTPTPFTPPGYTAIPVNEKVEEIGNELDNVIHADRVQELSNDQKTQALSNIGGASEEQFNTIAGETINIISLSGNSGTRKGVLITYDLNACKATYLGTATSSGDTDNFIDYDATLPSGKYVLSLFGNVNVDIRAVIRKNNEYYKDIRLLAGGKVGNALLEISNGDAITASVQMVNGTYYNEELYFMLQEGEEIPSLFVPKYTARDYEVRNDVDSLRTVTSSTVKDVEAIKEKKLDASDFYGIGLNLPNNFNYGENTNNPRLLYPQENEEHYPGVRVVADTDSPVKQLYGYKHEIYKGSQSGWQAIINSFPILGSDITSYCIGFWINISESADIFTDNKYLRLLFNRSNSLRYTIHIYIDSLIKNVGTVFPIDFYANVGIIEDADISAVCMAVDNGYAYIKIDIRNIVYVSGLDFNLLTSMNIYWQFDDVSSQLSNNQITFVGVTVLQNNTVEDPYYRYPDNQGLTQIPRNISIGGRIEQLERNVEPIRKTQLLLTYEPDNYEDVLVKCTVGEYTIENYMNALYDDESYNNTCHPRSCFVEKNGTKKQVLNTEDDGCPIKLTSGYLAAGHGYARGAMLTVNEHGKTYADIGSKWVDNNDNNFYLIKIIDENTLGFFGDVLSGNNDYDVARAIPNTSLTHVSGAVHTGTITGFTQTIWQVEPIVKAETHKKKILLNGAIEITKRGTYYGDFVDVIDEYDVTNPRDILDSVLSNKPSGGYTKNPDYNKGRNFIHFSNLYRFLNDGTLLLISCVDSDHVLNLEYWGGTQYAEKNSPSVFGGKCKKYIPGTLPITVEGVSYDMRIPYDMTSWRVSLDYIPEYWEDQSYPPDRCLTFYTDTNNVIKAGYAVGYLPVGLGEPSIRKNNVSNAINLYSSKKYYPHLIDNQNIPASQPLQSVVYRKPLIDVANEHTDAYFIPYGNVCYMYVDYHSTADERIKIPTEYIGKPMSVIQKSSNVTVYGTMTTNEVRIKCSSSSPMYGYAVILIG